MGIMCDDDEQEALEMYQLLSSFRRRNPVGSKRIVSICFADDKSHPPLQSADLFAYVCRLEEDRKITAQTRPGRDLPSVHAVKTTVRIFHWAESGTGCGFST